MTVHRVVVEGTLANQQVVNVFHVASESRSDQDLADGWITAVSPSYVDCLCVAYTGVEVQSTDLTFLTQYSAVWNDTGTVAGESCPPQVASLISWRTAQIGRANRGRTYLPALAELNQAGGILVSQQTDAMDAFIEAMLTWAESDGGNLLVWHRETELGSPIVNGIARPYAYTVRRRTIGVGS